MLDISPATAETRARQLEFPWKPAAPRRRATWLLKLAERLNVPLREATCFGGGRDSRRRFPQRCWTIPR